MVEARDLSPPGPIGERLRNTPTYRRWLRRGAIGGFAAGALIGSIAVRPPALLVWNATASAPIGLYRVLSGGQVGRGDMVVARPPLRMRDLAAARGYIPATVPLVKRVAAIDGDVVCAIGGAISVDSRVVAHRRASDSRGRILPWWHGCRRLGQRQYLLLNPAPASFDSRYFGPVGSGDIVGKAVPLWLR